VERFAFILCCARSASTFLRLRLDMVPGVVGLPETHFFVFREAHAGRDLAREGDRRAVVEAWLGYHRTKKWAKDLDREALRERFLERATGWKALLTETARTYAEEQGIDPAGVRLWVEKSPPHVFRQPAIRAMFPDASFVYLVRDPRAVVASLKQWPWSTSNVLVLARTWRAAARRLVDAPGSHLVKYEDLVLDPDGEWGRLCRHLDLPATGDLLGEASDDAVAQRAANSGNALRPISADHLAKWKHQLSREDCDRDIIEWTCAAEMDRFGYERQGVRRSPAFWLNLTTQALNHVALRLVRN
jgi:hypothetical protein